MSATELNDKKTYKEPI